MHPPIQKSQSIIEEAILETIVFFDLFDFPMTEMEIWRALKQKCDFYQVRQSLCELINTQSCKIQEKNGFYFLYGGEAKIITRLERYNFASRKIKRACRVAWLFSFLPWIRLVAVGNLIGSRNLKKDGDIDLFIITQAKRIWLTRLFCVGIISLFGLRPKFDRTKDTICLSFYISQSALDLQSLRLENDKYFQYWLSGLEPILDTNENYSKFIQTNAWLNEEQPNWREYKAVREQRPKRADKKIYNEILDLFFGGGERYVKKFQLDKLPPELKEQMNQGTAVVINDQVLKLYSRDRREYYKKKWQEKLNEITNSTNIDNGEGSKLNEFNHLPRFRDGRIDYTNSKRAAVLTCFIKYQEKILILKRSNQVSAYQGQWFTVAGYLDQEKSIEDKVLEEIKEETGITRDYVKNIHTQKVLEYHDQALDKTWLIHPVVVELNIEPKIKLDWEHTEHNWVKPEELKNFAVVPNFISSLRRAALL